MSFSKLHTHFRKQETDEGSIDLHCKNKFNIYLRIYIYQFWIECKHLKDKYVMYFALCQFTDRRMNHTEGIQWQIKSQ